ncbi:hypothetical protein, partial [Corynebacterium stationis]|uniref:hypothetical protein n=1 Tax=Corynebacterium stationis TaxID=1705 RepID=UPI00263AA261
QLTSAVEPHSENTTPDTNICSNQQETGSLFATASRRRSKKYRETVRSINIQQREKCYTSRLQAAKTPISTIVNKTPNRQSGSLVVNFNPAINQ